MKTLNKNDYKEYVYAQTKANKRKIDKIWVSEETIEQIYNLSEGAENILCHGTRNGKEQRLFRQFFPYANVIGTEISETAEQFKWTVQHDFHDEVPEWVNKFDIVYSNSWDHSYDGEKSLCTWRDQLNDSGYLFLECPTYHKPAVKSDPFEIKGKYHVDREKKLFKLFKKNNLHVFNTFETLSGYGFFPDPLHCMVYVLRKDKK
jgi:hypothetical protein